MNWTRVWTAVSVLDLGLKTLDKGQRNLPALLSTQVLEGTPSGKEEEGRKLVEDVQEGLRRLKAVVDMQNPDKVSFRCGSVKQTKTTTKSKLISHIRSHPARRLQFQCAFRRCYLLPLPSRVCTAFLLSCLQQMP